MGVSLAGSWDVARMQNVSDGRAELVVGASTGFGAAIAEALVARGEARPWPDRRQFQRQRHQGQQPPYDDFDLFQPAHGLLLQAAL